MASLEGCGPDCRAVGGVALRGSSLRAERLRVTGESVVVQEKNILPAARLAFFFLILRAGTGADGREMGNTSRT